MIYGVTWKQFGKDLKKEISEDNVSNGAAALAYYLFLAIFPAMIFMLSLLPYLPIPDLEKAVMDLLHQAMPANAASMFQGTIQEVTSQKRGGLLSLGLLLTLWSASSGMMAVMQQLNITYDVKEERPFWKSRGTALLLTVLFGALIVAALSMAIFGGQIQSWLMERFGFGGVIMAVFATVRWLVIITAMLLAFAFMYYLGPNVEQKFKFVSPGSIAGVALLALASLAFKFYVDNFGNYAATYGSIGAVIVLMLWLYVTGLVVLLGSEVNALFEHYHPQGKEKGEKKEPASRSRQTAA